MNQQKETVCAVVVTYNRKKLLIECIEALLEQTRPVDAIYIIDNASTDGTSEFLKEKEIIQELPPSELHEPWEREFKKEHIPIYYVRMNKNTGGAGGFYEGVKRAYEKGYDWLWLMDDDGLPDKRCLENMLGYKNKGDFLAPLVVNINKKDELSFGIFDEKDKKVIKILKEVTKEIYKNTANPFNGILISKQLVQKIGYPKKEMFIWGDEVEYQLRALKNGFNVLTIANAIHYHPKGRVQQKKILKLFYINWQDSKLKNYCEIRNRFYLIKKYSKYKILSFLKLYIKYSIATITFNLKFTDFLFMNNAMLDGLMEKWGKEKRYLGK